MGNQLNQPITSKVVERDGNETYRVAVAAMNGHREAMEDAHCIECHPTYGLFGVFDGHSGSKCSAYCAKNLPIAIQKRKPPLTDEDLVDITLQLDAAFMSECKESGCTACYCLVSPNGDGTFQLQVANVGDSRILVGRNKGAECVAMTEDHKPSVPAEQERIERCGGKVMMDRVDSMLAMSRAMGDADYKQGPGGQLEQKVIAKPDITRITCTADDWVLVACDGVFESNFSNEEVVEFVRATLAETNDDIARVVCAVCDEALKRGSADNVTCMLIQFRDGTEFKGLKPLFIPGPYATGRNFKTAYEAMAQKAGLTMGQALEMRYDMLRDQMTHRIKALKEGVQPQGQDEELKGLQEELALFKPGPLKLQGPERTQWFEQFATSAGANGEDKGPKSELEVMERLKQALAAGGGSSLADLLGGGDPPPAAGDKPAAKEPAASSPKEAKKAKRK
eukprot:EG_transcript_12752